MIITGIVFGFCSLIMIIIGIVQLKSKDPVSFYTGEEPPDKEEISDVKAWNRKHGLMWIFYGIIIILIWIIGLFIGESLWLLVPYIGGISLPIPFMIMYHHRLVKIYKIK